MAAMELKLVQDWTDYNKSILCSNQYYIENGSQIYQQEHPYPIPNALTNSLAHAASLMEILKANLANYPADHKITILDIGSGQGLFAKNILVAARELEILDRIHITVSDLSKQALEDIQNNKVLKEFDGHYDFLELDALNLPTSLGQFSMISMNYVYDALAMLPLKRNADASFEKMQVRLQEALDQVPSPYPLQQMIMERRWQNYDIKAASDLEQKYFKYLDGTEEQLFNYEAIDMTKNLSRLLDDQGFIFVAEMLEARSADLCFDLYGNCCAHETNELLIIRAMEAQGMEALLAKDSQLMRIFFFKNPKTKSRLKSVLYQEFNETTRTDKLLESIQYPTQ